MILSADELKKAYSSFRIDQLSDDGSGPDADIVSQAIAHADGIIKNALSVTYTTVAIEADNGVKRICAVLAIYFLESRRGDTPPQSSVDYKEAMELLLALTRGEIKLAAASEVLPSIERDTYRGPLSRSSLFDGLPVDQIEETE